MAPISKFGSTSRVILTSSWCCSSSERNSRKLLRRFIQHVFSGEVQPNRLVLGIIFQSFSTLLATVARHFIASKRRARVIFMPGIDPDSSRFDLVGKANGPAKIACLHARSQAIGCVVSDADGLFFAFEWDDR